MASQDAKDSAKLKIAIGITLVVVVLIGYGVSTSGLEKFFFEPVRQDWAAEGAAEKWYKAAVFMEVTFREEEAMKYYEEFYVHYAGDEQELEALIDVVEDQKVDDDRQWMIPWIANGYAPYNSTARPLVGTTAHELMPEVLLRYAKYWEGMKDYTKSDHLYAVVFFCFPNTEAQATAEKGRIRMKTRSF
ncbi:hypothetical protein OAX78_02420 [Planctomycetota bacterium]|nr:hypothetical protein [Planctomycetota bacterium]